MVMMISAADYSDLAGHFEDARPFYSYGDEEIETEEETEGEHHSERLYGSSDEGSHD